MQATYSLVLLTSVKVLGKHSREGTPSTYYRETHITMGRDLDRVSASGESNAGGFVWFDYPLQCWGAKQRSSFCS